MAAQIQQSADLLEQQMNVILAIRGTWQDLESRAYSILDSQPSTGANNPAFSAPVEPTMSSWSA
jgi:hypothetical protein